MGRLFLLGLQWNPRPKSTTILISVTQYPKEEGRKRLIGAPTKRAPQVHIYVGKHDFANLILCLGLFCTNKTWIIRDYAQHMAWRACALQHTATYRNKLWHTAPHCKALHYTVTHCNTQLRQTLGVEDNALCNTLQHTAPCCNISQHTQAHCSTVLRQTLGMEDNELCNTLQHTATHCNTLQHPATHCNTLQHTATHCNTLQHTATPNTWHGRQCAPQ